MWDAPSTKTITTNLTPEIPDLEKEEPEEKSLAEKFSREFYVRHDSAISPP
jgi:hypothetical protein